MKKVLLLTLIIITGCTRTDIKMKHPLDKSESRTLILENGLKVYLISDPSFNVSAASVAVEVGSLDNPKEREGLAHFLEHMLFLGTEKFPDVDEYSTYLKNYGGYSNAYTAPDHTNYQFQVLPDGFQRSEFLLEHGHIDMVVQRPAMKETLVRLINKLMANQDN